LLAISYCFIPESAGYIQKVKQEKMEEANINSDYLSHPDYAVREKKKRGFCGQFAYDMKELFYAATSSKKAFIIGIFLGIFVQATGINAIMNYAPIIFGLLCEVKKV
jgi:hypothetical protein